MPSISPGFRPPRPSPQPKALGPIALLKALRRNPLECWTKAHFEEPIVLGGFPFGRVAVVNEPAAIRKVLVENSHDYRKSALERRILSPRLRNGLVAVDAEQWSVQRRTLAPLFTRKALSQLAPAMVDAAAALVARWRDRPQGSLLDVKTEMSALALDGLVRSIFHEGIAGDAQAMRTAMVTFFESAGHIDPFDVIGLPDFIPRITRWRVRALLRSFDAALDATIAQRRRGLNARATAAACDMLGIMLAARDPETERRLSEAELKGNVLTFIFAGQETTSTALTWALYLLSQSPEWAARITAESERAHAARGEEPIAQLPETRAVLDEAMRLYPPIVGITRTATKEASSRDAQSRAAPWLLSLPMCCTGMSACGMIRTASIRAAFSTAMDAKSIAIPICPSAWDRACASARGSPCRRRPLCWRPSCAISCSRWRRVNRSGRSKGSRCGRAVP